MSSLAKEDIAAEYYEENHNQFQSNIQMDPLTRFAIVFGALIHDVDHQGVSNMQLIQEGSTLAKWYEGRCIAEQNSFDTAWRLLMQSSYNELRFYIFRSDEEMQLFRQIVINVVMATDIFDKDLKLLRDSRWNFSFSERATVEAWNDSDNVNRKATILIEHLIQTSDVVHTMQHWNVYQKWNHRLFREMYGAYKCGRSAKNPCDSWYDGELWFFDNYVIPLAQKLKMCGVFGANCDVF
jgi:3'5'-cyclic nucleotide phosphodiesterase